VENADIDIGQAARRELEEETGFTAKFWKAIGTLHPNPASHTNRVHTYLALDAICDHPQRLDHGEEGLTVLVVPIPEVLAKLRTGFIGQATHVSSILLALDAAEYPRP
jgi:8-oxo-dGTP pyrophosphatase MutT (NUDIX family)